MDINLERVKAKNQLAMLKREQNNLRILCVGTLAIIKNALSEYGADAFLRVRLNDAGKNLDLLRKYKEDYLSKQADIKSLEEALGISDYE